MASADEAVVIDTLAPGIDLKPFFELMGTRPVLKVFHAARQDIEIVWHQSGTIPHPIFDTQVAAMVLGYGDSIAYDQLVERVTGHRPDKTHRFHRLVAPAADAEQMHYAVSDVTHLRDVFAALDADLKKRRPQRLGQRGNGSPDLAENLRFPPRARLGAAQDRGCASRRNSRC
jgi:ribonuclease D